MDPSIVKLLEEDEDESMHSGADVDAFQAALNRDIEGSASTSQPSDCTAGSNPSFGRSFMEWQKAPESDITHSHSLNSLEGTNQEQHPSEIGRLHIKPAAENKSQQSVLQESKTPSLQPHQSQDSHQRAEVKQNPSLISQTTEMQISGKNPPLSEPQALHNQDSEVQYMKLQKMSSQQASATEQPSSNPNRVRQVPFGLLLPVLVPQLDKDRAMQLHNLYSKLKKNEITKDGFVRHMRNIVGDQVLRLAVNNLQTQRTSTPSQLPSQALGRQSHPTQFSDSHSLSQLQSKSFSPQQDSSHAPPSAVKAKTESFYTSAENSVQKPREVERQLDSRGNLVGQISSSNSGTMSTPTSIQGITKPPQHVHVSSDSLSMYGSTSGSYHPYPGSNLNSTISSLAPKPHDSQMRQVTHSQSLGHSQFRGSSHPISAANLSHFEKPISMSDASRVQAGSASQFPTTSQPSSAPWQGSSLKEQTCVNLSSAVHVKQESFEHSTGQHPRPSYMTAGSSAAPMEHGVVAPGTLKDEPLDKQSSRTNFPMSSSAMPTTVLQSKLSHLESSSSLSSPMPSITAHAGLSSRTPPKKPSVGQKKPLDTLGSSPPSKKQKVTAASLDQSIEQLNDVTAVSGVNLREEEEQLFSGSKEDSRVSEASRRVVQEEEEKLFLQKTPLQKKLAEIMVKNGLKSISSDVERCLSLCAEERMRGLISNLIRLSKQRVDLEKSRHRTVVTSDIRQQIIAMNQKIREEWEKKQAEAEKLRKLNEPDNDTGAEGEKEKDEGRSKSVKVQVNREEDEKMRTTAANVAARAAVGGDDMLSKWQLMAEQARQKREGGSDIAVASQGLKDISKKVTSGTGRNAKDTQETGRRSGTGNAKRPGRNQAVSSQIRVTRTISIKDVIAVLEREPQMSRSTLIYRLYERIRSEVAAE